MFTKYLELMKKEARVHTDMRLIHDKKGSLVAIFSCQKNVIYPDNTFA